MADCVATDPLLLEEGSTVASEQDNDVLDLVAPDVIIVLHNPHRPHCKDGHKHKMVDVEDLLDNVLVNAETAAENFPQMTALAKEVPRCDVEQAVLDDLCSFCSSAGFSVMPFLSLDHDEIFLRVSVSSDEVAGIYAERYSLRLQTTPDLVRKLGVEQPLEDISPAYMPFSRKQQARFMNNDSGDITHLYKRYWENGRGGSNGSIFRVVDRVRMIYRKICDELDLDDLLKYGIVKAHYAVHTRSELAEFDSWASFAHCDPCFNQPVTKIRNYFGEKQGYFFAWAAFSAKSLIPLTMVCFVLVRSLQVLFRNTTWILDVQQDVVDAVAYGAICFALVVWVAIYLKSWKRVETDYQHQWDCDSAEEFPELEPARPDFVGTLQPSIYDARVRTRQYSNAKVRLWKMFTSTVTLLFIVALVAAVVGVFSLQDFFNNKLGPSYGSYAVSITMAVQIKTFGFVWNVVAPWLVALENPRTTSQHSSSLLWKLFLFQFINCYYSFFYIAFVQRYRGGCVNEDCLSALRSSLHTTFGSLAVISLVELAIPYISFKWAQWKEDGKLRRDLETNASESELPKRCFMEDQAKRPKYDQGCVITDMLELVLQLGYVMLFGNVAPGIILVCLALLAVRLRADAWKLCNLYQRPRPYFEGSLGAVNDILRFLAKFSPYSLIALPLFNLDIFEPLGFRWKIILFLAAKELLDMLRQSIEQMVSDLSDRARTMQIRRRYVLTKLVQRSAKVDYAVPAAALASVKSSHLHTLNQHSSIWKDIDSIDNIRSVPSEEDSSRGKLPDLLTGHDTSRGQKRLAHIQRQ